LKEAILHGLPNIAHIQAARNVASRSLVFNSVRFMVPTILRTPSIDGGSASDILSPNLRRMHFLFRIALHDDDLRLAASPLLHQNLFIRRLDCPKMIWSRTSSDLKNLRKHKNCRRQRELPVAEMPATHSVFLSSSATFD
jgi:hypothetical protein